MNVFSKAAVNSIEWYQTELSPKKGFCCAYRIRHKGLSCSAVVKQAFISRGFVSGIHELFAQATRCRIAAIGLAEESRDSLPEETDQNRKNKSCADDIPDELVYCCSIIPWY
ncbi:MAG: membrane protein insertion efficiency factor YidD [Methyloglobulus sp.]|nr:membrane protein insertion efficiency factor YidD [Methyloglobulus sp.]